MGLIRRKDKVQVVWKRDFADTLMHTIDEMIAHGKIESDDDKLLFAGLAEVSKVLYNRLGKSNHEFTISFSMVQALSLRMLYTDYINDPTSYTGVHLMKLASEVHQCTS